MKQIYTLITVIMLAQLSFGQIQFQNLTAYDRFDHLNGALYIQTADLDSDGDFDIVVYDFGLRWYENLDGLGSFGLGQEIGDNFESYYGFKLVDLDLDGDIDIVTPSGWFENTNGEGTFMQQDVFTVNAPDQTTVSIADIDGDNDMDVLISNVLYINENNTFDNFYEVFDNQYRSGFSDLDNDGDEDIIVLSSGSLSWYENLDGLGNFSASVLITGGLSGGRFFEMADMDNDNDIDIVSISIGDGETRVHRNLGSAISWSVQTVLTSSAYNYRSLNVTDIDNDGDIDIGIHRDAIKYRWYENDGSGNFQVDITNFEGSNYAHTEDIDGDGDLDLIAENCDFDIDWYDFPYEDSGGSLDFETTHLVNKELDSNVYAVYSDIDSDGDLDVISNNNSGCNTKGLFLHRNVNGYILRTNVEFLIAESIDSFQALDIDDDGDDDLITYQRSSGLVKIFTNEDNGETFIEQNSIDTANGQNSFLLEDLDGDGDKDLIVTFDDGSKWLENENGNFIGNNPISNFSYPVMYSTDMDFDGDFDIVYFKENEIGWIENTNGLGTFGSENQIALINDPIGLAKAADIDGDLDVDIVTYAEDLDALVLFENQGGMVFSDLQIIAEDILSQSSANFTSLGLNDFDGDGLIDVVCSSTSNCGVFWYKKLEGMASTYGSQTCISFGDSNHVDVGDLNQDGDLDLVSASNSYLYILKNVLVLGNQINGQIHIDLDMNGCTSDDTVAGNILISSSNGSDSFSTFSQDNGSYTLNVNQGDFVSGLIQIPDYFTSNPSSQNVSFSNLGNTDIQNYCLEPIGTINDLTIAIYPSFNDPRPGFDTTYQLVYRNIGTTQLSGSVSFEYDDTKLQFLSATETIASQTSNTLVFDYTDLNPFETRTIDMEFNVFAPPITEIGDELISTATINPVSGDETEEDNVFSLEQTVIGSYDPNDITCLEGEQILFEDADKYLHYLIRFQNTGTASAINIRVENVLDDKLDWTTMQLESLSHDGRVEIMNGSEVSFIFDNINLPDSTNDEPNSHGYIAYKIKPRNDVSIGDVFYNTANIYFDFNPPITTNTASTEIVDALSINDIDNKPFVVYPNPTNDVLFIRTDIAISEIRVVDINGRQLKLLHDIPNAQSFSVDVSDLNAGLYFLIIHAEESAQTIKFIKL